MSKHKKSAHLKKFAKIAKLCQMQVVGGGKGRAKKVGACMKREFKK